MKHALSLLCGALALATGCQTVGGNRSAVFDGRTSSSSRGGSYVSPYAASSDDGTGWESVPAAPAARANPAAREATRVAELEARVSRLQSQVDSMSAAQESVVAQANATVSRSSATQDSIRSDLDALRMEVAALKAENQRLREEQASQRSQIAALPDRITKAVTAAMPKPSSGSARSSGASGASRGGSHECYEHVVAAGDTVSAIASAYGVKTSDIVRENNLKDAASIRVGQKLYVPKK